MDWISVIDKLPNHNERVLVIDGSDCKYIRTMFLEGLTLNTNQPSWCEFFDGYEVGNPDEVHTTDRLETYYSTTEITHWMPLPEKPIIK
jgi:hypothetical protein